MADAMVKDVLQMYVKMLSLKKLKAFKSLRLDFEPRDGSYAGLTVITGSNGGGKTTVLRALAAAMIGPDASAALQTSFRTWVTEPVHRTTIQAEFVPSKGDDTFVSKSISNEPFVITLQVVKNKAGETTLSNRGVKPRSSKYDPRSGGLWDSSQTGWFCAGYGAYRRLSRNERSADDSLPKRVQPFSSLFFTGSTLNDCEAWLKELDYRGRYSKQEGIGARELLESTVRFLNGGLLTDDLKVKRVDPDGAWLKRRDGPELPLSEMSDGERTSISLVLDILRHMEQSHKATDLFETLDGRIVVKRSGVVLIDELDAHIHPEWQREIGFWLKRAFPKVQFIVTTHSPIICQAADKDCLYRLQPSEEPEGVRIEGSDFREVVSSRPNAIYRGPAFRMRQLRPPEEESRRQEFAQLSAKMANADLTDGERRRRNELEAEIVDDYGGDENA